MRLDVLLFGLFFRVWYTFIGVKRLFHAGVGRNGVIAHHVLHRILDKHEFAVFLLFFDQRNDRFQNTPAVAHIQRNLVTEFARFDRLHRQQGVVAHIS